MNTVTPPASTSSAPVPGISPRRKRLRRLFVLLVLIVGGFCTYIALLPNEFQVQRSITIHNDPSVVFAHVNDFHKWDAWSPWAKLDPNSKVTFSGPDAGEGAHFTWNGNDEVGEGDMTIVSSQPHESIGIKLHFVRPMEDTADVKFTFDPTDDGTVVTWTMSGQNNFVGKIFCLFMNMDKMVGGDFEKGLASMKLVAEAPPASSPEPSVPNAEPSGQPE